MGGRQPRIETLQSRDQIHQIAQLGGIEIDDPQPLPRLVLDQPVLLHDAERLADGTAAHAGLLRDLHLAQPLARAVFPGDDVPLELIGDPEQRYLEDPVRMLRAGKFALPGDGGGILTPVYVDDLVDCVVLALLHPDAGGRAVIPGFVDSHAHLVFDGDRSAEFAARMTGVPYDGGGIANSVRATRAKASTSTSTPERRGRMPTTS